MNRLLAVLVILLMLPVVSATHTSQQEFISNPSASKFGFDYAEDVTNNCAGNPNTGPCPGDEYSMDGSQGDFSYLGTDLLGKKIYQSTFGIKAGQDGLTSGFAVFFSQVSGTPSSSTKGDGKTTGAFANGVKLWMKEVDNDWRYEIRQVIAGTESAAIATATSGSPNTMTGYKFIVNSQAHTAQLQKADGTQILNAGISSQLSSGFYSQWFVGFGFASIGERKYLAHPDTIEGSTQILDMDPRAPTISGLTRSPLTPAANQIVTVTCSIQDDWGDVTANLEFLVNNVAQTPVAMTGHFTGYTYSAQIPGQAAGSTVKYRVVASDHTQSSTTAYAQYTIPAPTSSSTSTTTGATTSSTSDTDSTSSDSSSTSGGGGTVDIIHQNPDRVLLIGALAALVLVAMITVRGSLPKKK